MASRMLTCAALCSTLFITTAPALADAQKKTLANPAQGVASPEVGAGDQVPIIIKYRDGYATALSRSDNTGNIEIRNVAKEDIEVELQKLRMNDAIEFAEPNYITRKPRQVQAPVPVQVMPQARSQSIAPGTLPNDPFFSRQITWQETTDVFKGRHSGLKAVGGAKKNAPLNIGVIDSEFRSTDDLQYAGGYNFSRLNSSVGPEFLENIYEPSCEGSHGTAVANIIAAPTNNGTGVAGFVDANVWAVRSMSCGTGYLYDTAESIRWLAGDPSVAGAAPIGADIDIINASLGANSHSCPSYLQDAIDYAFNKGITIVVAAGNDAMDASQFAPANCDRVITVGSVNQYGSQSWFTNYGDNIDVAALGERVTSMVEYGVAAEHYGTSFSSPNVAGMAALIKQTNPMLGPDEIKSYLKATARRNPEDATAMLGAGIVQPATMVSLVKDRFEAIRPTVSHVLDNPERCNKQAYKAMLPDSANVCQLYEIDASKLETGGQHYTVFESDAKGDMSASTATAIKTSADPLFLVPNLAGSGKQYGIGLCDAKGNNCSGKLIPLGNAGIITDKYCDN